MNQEKFLRARKNIKLIRQIILLIPTVLILGFPYIISQLIIKRVPEYRSIYFRRDFPMLLSIDIALAQNFAILVGYILIGSLIVILGSFFGLNALHGLSSWVTLNSYQGSINLIFCVILGAYGMFGIALLTGLIVSAYNNVRKIFPQTDEEFIKYWTDIFGITPTQVSINSVIIAISDTLRKIVTREDVATPTLYFLWKRG